MAGALGLDLKTLRHFSAHSAKDRIAALRDVRDPQAQRRRAPDHGAQDAAQGAAAPAQRAAGRASCRSANTRTASAPAIRCAAMPQPHVGRGVVLRLDIKDFFPSIHFGRVRGLLIALGYGYPVATVLAALMTEAPRQPVMVGEVRHLRAGRAARLPARRARRARG